MTTTDTHPRVARPTAREPVPEPRRPRAPWALVGVALIAVLVRWWPVHQGAGLTGRLDYDDGVYYVGSAALLAGRLPYDDFLLLHPPGILLLLLPFAALGEATTDMTGFVAARLAFIGLGAVNALLVAAVVRRIAGAWVGVLAGLFYAVWRPTAFV